MSSTKWFRRTFGAALVAASVVSVTAVGGPATNVVSAQTSIDAGGEFHPLTPTRILDTRPSEDINDVAPKGPKAAGVGGGANITAGEFSFNPLGLGGLPENAEDILAVVMTVTVADPTQAGYLATYPTGFEFGGADGTGDVSALITYGAGELVPNLGIVGLGEDGTMTFNLNMAGAGTANVIVDVSGFISTSQYTVESGARLEIVAPGRILDTRTSPNPRPGQSFGTNDSIALPIRGVDAVDPAVADIVPNRPTVTAVMINLALINNKPGSRSTFVTATPDAPGAVAGTASSVAAPGIIKSTNVIAPIGADGSIHLFNRQGDLDLVVDVLGYFETGADVATNRGRIVPLLAPFRAFDTRLPEFNDAPLEGGNLEQWSFEKFAESVTLNPGATNEQEGPAQQGFIGDLFAVGLEKRFPEQPNDLASFLQLTPGGLDNRPLSANVTFGLGEAVPNMSLIKYGDDEGKSHIVEAFNAVGFVDYIMDVYAIVLDD